VASRKLTVAALLLSPLLSPAVPQSNRSASNSAPPAATGEQSSQVEDLKKENRELRQQLEKYKALEEDMMAQEVFEKAKSRLIEWLTFGGIAVVLAGIVGYKAILDYLKTLIDKKLQSVSKTEIERLLAKESERQIHEFVPQIVQDAQVQMSTMVQGQRKEIMLLAQEQIARIVTAGPIGPKPETVAPAPAATAAKIDYSAQMHKVKDQGPEGSVIGMSLSYAIEYQIKKTLNQTVEISPRFIYYYARKLGGDTHSDSGTTISNGIKVLSTQGAVAEEAWPYKGGEFAEDPPESVRHAKHYKIKKSYRLQSVENIKSALEQYGPIIAGIAVYRSLMSDEVRRTGRVKLPEPSDTVWGGHSLCLVGYDDADQMFKFINSWGEKWGDHGYGYLPYKYLEGGSSDCWAITM